MANDASSLVKVRRNTKGELLPTEIDAVLAEEQLTPK